MGRFRPSRGKDAALARFVSNTCALTIVLVRVCFRSSLENNEHVDTAVNDKSL